MILTNQVNLCIIPTMEVINIPKVIKKIRADLGLTQAGLGKAIGKDRQLIADLENGRRRPLAEDWIKIQAMKTSQGAKTP